MRPGRMWREAVADLAGCLRFFSRLPLPDAPRQPPLFARMVRLLPLAALVIGACGASPLGLAAAMGLPHPMAAIVGIACGLLATGALHEDGLADVADGFGGGFGRTRKLDIMRDSRIGTYGVLAVATMLAWRIAALSALLDERSPIEAGLVVTAAAVISRALALLPLAILPPARADGLGHGAILTDRGALSTAFGLAAIFGVALPLTAGLDLGHALLACVLAGLASLGVTALAKRQIGGQTGDVAGACQQAAEAAFLLGLMILPGAG